MSYSLLCPACGRSYSGHEVRYRCDCSETLDITLNTPQKVSRELFDNRLHSAQPPYNSGVWRYREMLPAIADASITTRPEGNTNLYSVGAGQGGGHARIGRYAGADDLYLKHEGENPTGSFKDRGMTVGVSQAVSIGARAVACASTGNTSASLASYAAQAGLPCFVFMPEGTVAAGKLAQTLAYGSVTLQIRGDFDRAMQLVEQLCGERSIYLLNSINPFRIEGQKTITFELLQQLGWEPPDWIVLPAGNLGNTAALGKALIEARDAGLINRLPRIAAVQSTGANPFFLSYQSGFTERFSLTATTVATAIRIGAPVSYTRARRAIEVTRGTVINVTDAAILEAKAVIDRSGIGCEPASAASLAGVKQLIEAGTIQRGEQVVAILTGHLLKDSAATIDYHMSDVPHANRPIVLDPDVDQIRRTLERYS